MARLCALAQRSSPKLPPAFPGARFPLGRDAPGRPIPVFILTILKVFGPGPLVPKEILLTWDLSVILTILEIRTERLKYT